LRRAYKPGKDRFGLASLIGMDGFGQVRNGEACPIGLAWFVSLVRNGSVWPVPLAW